MNSTITIVAFYVVILVLLFLPIYLSNKKKKKHFNQMMDKIKIGTKIETIGGIFGTISKISDTTFEIQVSPGVSIKITKGAVARVVE